jgi:sugar phosphate isomerase/epimerase
MQRRTLLKSLGATLTAPLFAPSLGNAAAEVRWKTAIGLNGFASGSGKYKKTYPIWEILDFASRHGFDGVELVEGWPMGDYPDVDDRERIDMLCRFYECYGLQIFSIQMGAGGAFSPVSKEREDWFGTFENRARFAKKAGCDCIGMWPGGGLRGQSLDEAFQHLGDSFRKACDLAVELHLVPTFEIEPPFVFNTEEHLKRIFQVTDHPALKTTYDPSHYDLMNGSTGNPHEMLHRIGVEKIGYVHLTDTDGALRDGGTSKHLACGDGHVDIDLSLRTLRDGGFEGWIMIDAWEIPDPYDACAKGKEAIERVRNESR